MRRRRFGPRWLVAEQPAWLLRLDYLWLAETLRFPVGSFIFHESDGTATTHLPQWTASRGRGTVRNNADARRDELRATWMRA
jgi:hypothetical protein